MNDLHSLGQAADEKRSAAPRIVGIISLIFGVVYAGLNMVSVVEPFRDSYLSIVSGLATKQGKTSEGVQKKFTDFPPKLKPKLEPLLAKAGVILHWEAVALVLFSLLLAGVGVGLIAYQRWAKNGMVAWAVFALLGFGVLFYVDSQLVEPLIDKAAVAVLDWKRTPDTIGTMGLLSASVSSLMTLVLAPYPIVLLIFSRNRKFRLAFAEKAKT